ncbi:hypothetical protein EV421DRAFT_1700423 [Armillaria borealis]|uniref:Uncharacterized protein n=1 Tax=Armillaria borealis TaxID=47425 RepID=A0AA39N257_9AGAR|nr:hypothetical protein EV421DRAFT_1700423 [Armillaria borealis]
MSSTHEQPTQQPQRVRKPAFSDWPTIKILTPPQGRFSPKTDEWCITYCTQTVKGRFNSQEPSCRSLCIRRIFAHEVRNILSFRRHQDVDEEGKAKYPLPAEGQPVNMPRYLGGKASTDTDDEPTPQPERSRGTKYWDEGWYLWTSSSHISSVEKIQMMKYDLRGQVRREHYKEQRKATWQEYQQFIERNAQPVHFPLPDGEHNKWWGAIVPPPPIPDTSSHSLLIPLPPQMPPAWDGISKLLQPTRRVLTIFRDSLVSGEHLTFAGMVWRKAWTKEPYFLVRRTLDTARDMWKGAGKDDNDDEKDSTH